MSQSQAPLPELELADDPEAVLEAVMTRGWGDGLPVVPPTEERVASAIAASGLPGSQVIAVLPPRNGAATVHKIAVNAVLAGCQPEVMPILIAAVTAMGDPALNATGIQTTTNPVTIAGFISGPAGGRLGFNAGWNCLGQGNRANATVGRAIRLILVNIAGGIPGEADRATMGQPGKYTFFFAENEADAPWPPFRVREGFDAAASTVTMFGAAGTLNLLEPTDSAEDLLRVIATAMRFPASNDYMYNGEPWLILSPEHAWVLARGGHASPATVQEYLWEQTRMRPAEFSAKVVDYRLRPTWEPLLGPIGPETLIPIAEHPERIRIVVAGGPGTHSTYVPTFGASRSVTVGVAD